MRDMRPILRGLFPFFAVLLTAALAAPAPSFAMGGTEDAGASAPIETTEGETTEGEAAEGETPEGEGAEGEATAPVVTCPEGFELTVDEATQESNCKQSSSALERTLPAVGWNGADPAFVEAAVLAHSGAYEKAIDAFNRLGRAEDPYVLNYLGYSNRKLGNVEAALAYYHKALSIRPDYVRVREYMGEGYVALGRIDEAREQLALIAEECGTGCDEYRTLEAAIAEHLATSNG